LRIADDDTAGVWVSATSLELSEALTATNHLQTYTVRLASEPTAPVTITLAPDRQATVSPPSLVFTAANWSAPQTVTVTAVDDAIDEVAFHPSVVRHAVASPDAIYDGFAVADLTLSIADDDTAGVLLSATSLKLSEALTATNYLQTYTVRLASEPTAPVTITLAEAFSGDLLLDGQAQLVITPAALTFTAQNWNLAQNVTVQEPPPLPSGFTLMEGGAMTYTVRLTSRPVDEVTIEIVATAGITVTPSRLTFDTSSNGDGSGNGFSWNVPQTVSVVAAPNDVVAPNPSPTIAHTAESSHDKLYRGLLETVTVSVTDDDVAGVEIIPTALSLSETLTATNQLTYTVRLTSQPTAPVTITPIFDTAQLSVTAQSMPLELNAGNWRDGVEVTVQAVDDAIQESDPHTVTITHGLTSTDPVYAALPAAPVTVTIADNDKAGVIVEPAGLTLSESPTGWYTTTGTISVSLRSRPTAPVTVSLGLDSQLTTDVTTLVFDPTSWSVSQTITLTAVADGIDETDLHTAMILLSAESLDPNYNQPFGAYEVWIEDEVVIAPLGFAAPPSAGQASQEQRRSRPATTATS
jgi:hypothetical protein